MMNKLLSTLFYFVFESFSTRRDAQIRFLREENRMLRSRLDSQRIILSPEERSRLLKIGKELKHQVQDLLTIVQYRTYQRWLIEQQAGKKPGRVGRPRTITKDIQQAIIRIAKENPAWGYLRIVGELLKLRCKVGKTSVRRILKEECLRPRPRTPNPTKREDYQTWDNFIKLHINTLVACDFFCKAIWTPLGKRYAYVLAFIHIGSRKVWTSSATYHPNEAWVKQQGRNLLMWLEDNDIEATHLIRDRDTKFAKSFTQLLKSSGIQTVKSPVCAPNANAFAEAWVATIRRECLNYFTCFSLGHLDHIVYTYTNFYNTHRPHQRMDNRTLRFPNKPHFNTEIETEPIGEIGYTSELGGLLKHYYRKAA